ncbi:MAG: hypothetical protein JWQ35_2476 [Bacteriovoracaceae bacterium]|nr:hypothetical protein [Bacteriovoracaceae bacterium]
MAEWLKALVSKTSIRATVSRVQIPPSPNFCQQKLAWDDRRSLIARAADGRRKVQQKFPPSTSAIFDQRGQNAEGHVSLIEHHRGNEVWRKKSLVKLIPRSFVLPLCEVRFKFRKLSRLESPTQFKFFSRVSEKLDYFVRLVSVIFFNAARSW